MSDDELNHWLAQLNARSGWTVYQVGDEPPPPLVAVNNRHYFTDVVIIRSAHAAVAYRAMLDNERTPDASQALWTYSGDADSALAAVFALSNPARPIRRLPTPPNYRLPVGELRDITGSKGDVQP
ncbi:MAG TPA: hypothetical protein VHZ97_15500 [Pseudonocardiaceae bacterium]|jgi:hypothetical protein|nr:hypothetical protein [Pseudonocardiaceae bacterium]